jgi:hypothetical protein
MTPLTLRSDHHPLCLSCGVELAKPLRRASSLRCHDCREARAPISFELALRAREIREAQATDAFKRAVSDRQPAT